MAEENKVESGVGSASRADFTEHLQKEAQEMGRRVK